jgi:hypothetical protein
VTTLRVVPALDEVEHGDIGLSVTFEASSMNESHSSVAKTLSAMALSKGSH